jgi:hypothetical protein
MERRRLVGRRYEDYLRNKIVIELTAEELLWRMVLRDFRYNSLIERRKGFRRKTDKRAEKSFVAMKPGSSFMFMRGAGEE